MVLEDILMLLKKSSWSNTNLHFDFGIIHIDLFTGLLSLNYRKSKYKNKSSNQYALPYYKNYKN